MPRRPAFLCSLILLAFASVLSTEAAFAQRRGFGPNPDRAPSVFAYGFRGLGIGLPVGLSAGYLLTRDDDWGREDWRDVGVGAGIGAVSGAVGGLGVGFYDLYDRRPGVGMVVLRDTWYGTLLGATLGLVVGTIFWIDNGDAENVLVGGAWGTVIGAPVGTVIGFIEGPTVRDVAISDPEPRYAFSLQLVPTPSSPSSSSPHTARTILPTFGGTF